MPSSDLGSFDLSDIDTGHVNGPYGHDVINDWIDIATRPASVNGPTAHSVAGVLTLDANLGHVARVTVSANITDVVISNLTIGLPYLIFLEGDGLNAYTADLSSIALNSTENLSSEIDIAADTVLQIALVKVKGNHLWAPAGVISFATGSIGSSGIIPVASASRLYVGNFVTSFTIPIPAGVVSGDLIELFVQTQENTGPGGGPTINTPAGWNLDFTTVQNAGYVPKLTKFWKIANGSEGGTDVTITFGTAGRPVGASQVWRGVNTTTPYDVAESTVVNISSNNNPNPVTTITENTVVVVFAAGNIYGGGSCTPPSGYALTVDQSSSDRSIIVCYKNHLTIGQENPGSFIWGTDNSASITYALRPAT